MEEDRILTKNTGAIVGVITLLLILFPFGYSVVSAVLSPGGENARPFLDMPPAKYKECIKETEYMRYHHMHLLQEVRDDALREGIRGDIKLDECRKCHTNRAEFCDRCHLAVNLWPDCYGCHYYPENAGATDN